MQALTQASCDAESSLFTRAEADMMALYDEIVENIMLHMPALRDLALASGVCQAWNELAKSVLLKRVKAYGGPISSSRVVDGADLCKLYTLDLMGTAHELSGMMSTTRFASVAVDAKGRLMLWGILVDPQQGTIPSKQLFNSNLPVAMSEQIVSVSAGHGHILALNEANEVLSFGSGEMGCLGHGDRAGLRDAIRQSASRARPPRGRAS